MKNNAFRHIQDSKMVVLPWQYKYETLHNIFCVQYLECECVYSNSRNDVPRVAQRYGTIAAHIGAVRPSALCM